MNYKWDGDYIVQDCRIDRKRYVLGCKEPIVVDIREFVSPADDAVLKEIVAGLVRDMGLPTTKEPGSFDRRAMIVWEYVARSIAYCHDAKKQRKGDFWLFPSEVYTMAFGDCEDSSFLLASLLIASGISPYNVRVVLGEILRPDGKSAGGHAWPIYRNEFGCWCILESTLDVAHGTLPSADNLSSGRDITYSPKFCFNNAHLWGICGDHERRGLNKYIDGRKKLANLRGPEFPSGGIFRVLMLDFTPGHAELTTEVLQDLSFSGAAIAIAADAAQDPDFYEWYQPKAHAQTANGDDGRVAQTEDAAVAAYLQWVKDRSSSYLQQDDPRNALFFLGYLLHGIQDLASHQGVTNAQHSYESHVDPGKENDRDHLAENRELAKEFCRRFLGALQAKNPSQFDKVKTFTPPDGRFGPTLFKSEKAELLGVDGWDLKIMDSISEYNDLAGTFAAIPAGDPERSILWDRTAVFAAVLTQ